MISGSGRRAVWLATAILIGASVVSCVKIETGQTADEAKQSAEVQAGNIRADWAKKMQGASEPQIAALIADHFNYVTAQYFNFSNELIKRWEDGESGRGQPISGTEMRKFVTAWTGSQQPVLTAFDDNLEYSYSQLKQGHYYSEAFMAQVKDLVDEYYEVYSVVFLPNGTLDDYRYKVEQERYKASNQLAEYRRALSSQ
jgi:hypothetical protein